MFVLLPGCCNMRKKRSELITSVFICPCFTHVLKFNHALQIKSEVRKTPRQVLSTVAENVIMTSDKYNQEL